MVDFKKMLDRKVVSPKLVLKLEIELLDSLLTDQEAADRINYLINSGNASVVSEFIVFLIRETRSSRWELKTVELKNS